MQFARTLSRLSAPAITRKSFSSTTRPMPPVLMEVGAADGALSTIVSIQNSIMVSGILRESTEACRSIGEQQKSCINGNFIVLIMNLWNFPFSVTKQEL
jgi:hypothetical protein